MPADPTLTVYEPMDIWVGINADGMPKDAVLVRYVRFTKWFSVIIAVRPRKDDREVKDGITSVRTYHNPVRPA